MASDAEASTLPPFEIGYAHTELRRELVAAVLAGEKTTTTGLWSEFQEEGEAVPDPGERFALLGFDDEPVAVVEVVEATVVPAGEVTVDFARDEGEGFETVEDWRVAHERFFETPIGPDTKVVTIRFRVVRELEAE